MNNTKTLRYFSTSQGFAYLLAVARYSLFPLVLCGRSKVLNEIEEHNSNEWCCSIDATYISWCISLQDAYIWVLDSNKRQLPCCLVP